MTVPSQASQEPREPTDMPKAGWVSILKRAVGAAPQGAILGIATHHERWNGTGYPDGLTAAEIPFEGRIIAIADAFSAMTVNRAYRVRVQPFEALSEMARIQGQFDPSLLRTFVLLLASSQSDADEDEADVAEGRDVEEVDDSSEDDAADAPAAASVTAEGDAETAERAA